MLCISTSIPESSNDDEDGNKNYQDYTTQQDLIQVYLPTSVNEYAEPLLPVGLIGELLSPRAGKPRF
jgi:hypothetical protein